MQNLFNLSGKTALVTGCSRGIGLAIATGLASAGANIIGTSATLRSEGSACEMAVDEQGREFTGYAVDLGDRAALYSFIETLLETHGVPDILVNNAGIIRRNPAAIHRDEDWDAVLAVNLDAPFILARELGRRMCERGSGKIIFTASLLSFQGGLTVPSYAASKGAIAQLTKALANEWAGQGVSVNALVPGYIATDNTEALRHDTIRNQQILARIPAGRWGTPQDMAGPAVFLASDAAAYVHGEMLVVDGGWMGR